MMYSKQCSGTMQRHATYLAVTKFPCDTVQTHAAKKSQTRINKSNISEAGVSTYSS